jgi:biotin carboxylase
MSTYLITGRTFANLEAKILERGDNFILLADQAITKSHRPHASRILADFSTKESIQEAARALKMPIDGVVTIYENYVLPAAWIAEALHLHGLPLNAAEACTDKYIMRTLFSAAPEKISPGFAVIESLEQVLSFASNHQYPLILKPANLAKSLLVTKNQNEEELRANYKKMTEQIMAIYKKYAPHRQPKMLIEEFMHGSIHSVDAFVDAHGNPNVLEQVVDYQTGYDIGYNDNFHYSRLLPSKLTTEDLQKLRHVAQLGVQALGMKNSPAHIEIIMTPSGPQIVEIGARNGGYRERMHRLANGIDLLGATLDLAIGREPNITATKNDPCVVLELFPKKSGTFIGLHDEAALRALPSLVSVRVKSKAGTFVGKSADGYKACAVIILSNSNHTEFNEDLKFVDKNVYVETASF